MRPSQTRPSESTKVSGERRGSKRLDSCTLVFSIGVYSIGESETIAHQRLDTVTQCYVEWCMSIRIHLTEISSGVRKISE